MTIGDGEKERLLKTHSEKLALVFGLLTMTARTPIGIVKNFRVCEDFHTVMCGASLIMRREIVLRDNMRASDEYEDAVDEFIAFALAPLMDKTSIRCPCISCKNFNHLSRYCKDHLIIEGIDMAYDPFVLHGEEGQVHVVDEGVETIDFNLTETYEML
ncbi:hypothetical protein IFM89_003631 [Coptis chinensis]|uniref:DYW domain-containing protein n=1 Tax=Coptis chinensis TaxID=261450 RepID=A0A835GVF3_9MAGN|nr:hypothetical protein IFM89_003631 [Coptis chinensis]